MKQVESKLTMGFEGAIKAIECVGEGVLVKLLPSETIGMTLCEYRDGRLQYYIVSFPGNTLVKISPGENVLVLPRGTIITITQMTGGI